MNRPTFDRMGVVALIFPEGFACVMTHSTTAA